MLRCQAWFSTTDGYRGQSGHDFLNQPALWLDEKCHHQEIFAQAKLCPDFLDFHQANDFKLHLNKDL